jgi:hypothetical protein
MSACWQQAMRYCEILGTCLGECRRKPSLLIHSSVEGSGGSKAAIAWAVECLAFSKYAEIFCESKCCQSTYQSMKACSIRFDFSPWSPPRIHTIFRSPSKCTVR